MPLAGGLVAKTPAYASCEVLEGDNPNSQDDLFSLAAVAYRVLTGQRPVRQRQRAGRRKARNASRYPCRDYRPSSGARSARRWPGGANKRSADVQSFLTEFFGEEEIVLASPEPASARPLPLAAEAQATQPSPARPTGPETQVTERAAAAEPESATREATENVEPVAEALEDDDKSRCCLAAARARSRRRGRRAGGGLGDVRRQRAVCPGSRGSQSSRARPRNARGGLHGRCGKARAGRARQSRRPARRPG